ncbi:MAG: SYNERG-CTERM sorting domain-containing protein, partial [Synergistaceae bacterium]|nr:SYNERG-CTERM sorting domain-containing protein [Synergistaceae bacterium]
VSVTNGRFTLPATEDAEYELWVEAALPDGSTLKSDALWVVVGRGTLTAPGLTASPTSARAGEIVTFDLGEWINRREIVTPESVRWILNGVDVTELVIDGVLTVEAVAGEDGTMVLIVTATLPNGLTGTETATVTISAEPAPGPGPGPDEGSSSSGGCGNVGFGALAMIACASLILRRRS